MDKRWWILAVAALGIFGVEVYQGFRTMERNRLAPKHGFVLRVSHEIPRTKLTKITHDPVVDCATWEGTADVYYARNSEGRVITYADCDYDGKWDYRGIDGGARQTLALNTLQELEVRVKKQLELEANSSYRFYLQGQNPQETTITRGKWNDTWRICLPIPRDPARTLCGYDGYVWRESKIGQEWGKEYQLFVDTYKKQVAPKPTPKKSTRTLGGKQREDFPHGGPW